MDRHVVGVFARRQWRQWIAQAGFARVTALRDPYGRDVFTGLRRPD
jgi:hypothetical protein